VVHYQEIALKGRNRPWFIKGGVRNLRDATRDLDVRDVRPLMGRIEVVLGDNASYDTVRDRLSDVFGIGNFSRAGRAPLDVGAIAAEILKDLGPENPATFRVSAKRADKRFPLTSPQIEREVGGRIKEARGWTVDLDDPAFTIHVEALTGEAFYSFGRDPGAGGLPVGSSGRVACLLSGGIDSPVAAWRMMRRGCACCSSTSTAIRSSRASQEKARELVKTLTRFQFRSRLFLVPFGDIQQRVVLTVARRCGRRLSTADDADRGANRETQARAGARHR
jgi:thiamine biosynthesis protein ThiI